MEKHQENLLAKKNAELEKELAQKNRDLEIESALEKVRSSALAMRVPADMLDVCRIICEQLGILQIREIRNVQTAVFNEAKKTYTNYEYYRLYDKSFITEVKYGDHPVHNAFAKEMLTGPGLLFAYKFEGEELKGWITYQKESNQFADPHLNEVSSVNYYWFSLGPIAWGITFYAPVSEAELEIVKRFRNVFDLAYRRFADIQKAEEQAMEAQIELGLERVRARAMAMQNSHELAELISGVFNELAKLGFGLRGCALYIMDETSSSAKTWLISPANIGTPECVDFSFPNHSFSNETLKAWKKRLPKWVYDLKGVEKQSWHDYLLNETDFSRLPDPVKAAIRAPEKLFYSFSFSNFGGIQTVGEVPLSDANLDILSRFSKVFDQTYTRFNDLKQAEAQARESQIQLALERVRARTMAMQHSSELKDAASILFQQVELLGVNTWTSGFQLWEEDRKAVTVWTCTAGVVQQAFRLPVAEDDFFMAHVVQAEKNDETLYVEEISGKALERHYKYMATLPGLADNFKSLSDEGIALPTSQVNHAAFFNYGYLLFITYEPIPEAHDIFKRFAKVFDQTYTRFLDLQKAEAQTREAQIEAALEKVRSRSLAMHQTDELREVVSVVFEKLHDLEIVMEGEAASIVIFTDGTRDMTLWNAIPGQSYSMSFHIPYHNTVVISSLLEARGMDFYSRAYTFEEKNSHWKWALEHSDYKYLPEERKQFILASAHFACSVSFTKNSAILVSSYVGKLLSEKEAEILKRFARVFEQAYVRFLDLHKAEVQAREAIKQASVDRVRGEIASMRTTKDLERITPLIWNELTILGIPFIRCGVFIVDEEEQLIHTHLSTSEGTALATFDLTFESDGIGQDVLPAWRSKQIATVHWSAEEFATYTKNLVELGTVASSERYVTDHPDTSLDLHFFPFLQGMLYVGNVAPLTNEEKDLVQSLADAFSTAYARYEDFNKLEAAKQQVENTLADLKATQTKLIQSEKMASLGELTAGIAHEIQNPLNFVNNFSDVSAELIDEMDEELGKGDIEEAKAIAGDIKQNLEKIQHHGKRAEAIVRGMLEHSRASTGQKEPTDLNKLADEYFRLAYHGLRAKDKTFNAELVTDFDENLPPVDVIPQDIGRVLLNLFNNAFYAVNQKMKTAGPDYKPVVEVTTFYLPLQGVGGLRVRDNGIGIPDAIKEKIMQPFFTTKPTGEGTGLGLSLSYDIIVKAHGGKINIESKEGEGAEFIIDLPIA